MRRVLLAGACALALSITGVAAPSADAATTWLCKPGLADDACAIGTATTRLTPKLQPRDTRSPRTDRPRRVDCFYVYPTVSGEPGIQASLDKRPELRSIARYQAARYGTRCRIYAPVYRQLTLAGIAGGGVDPGVQAKAVATAYGDVRDAFREYLRGSHGRPFVIVGHSQGAAMGRRLVRDEIDGNPRLRKRMLSAILLGGNVTVKRGSDRGGDFDHVPACRRPSQRSCVIAFSTYDEQPPDGAIFGRSNGPLDRLAGSDAASDTEVLCTNPAALRGGEARLHTAFPSEAFASGTSIAAGISLIGFPLPTASTPWIAIPAAFSARCSDAGGANVLRVTARGGAPTPKASPSAVWGLHLLDANIAIDDLVDLVGAESRAYFRR